LPSLFCSEFSENLLGRPALPGQILLVALFDMGANLGVLEFEVVLKLIDVHEASDWDAVLFEDDVFLVEMDPLDQGAKIDAGFG